MPSLVIVDDSPDFCTSSAALLADEGFEVMACVGTGAHAVDAVRRLRPDAVLLDVQLPDIDGFEVARRLAALVPRPVVVLISSRAASEYGSALVAAPVRGFLDKVAIDGDALAALL